MNEAIQIWGWRSPWLGIYFPFPFFEACEAILFPRLLLRLKMDWPFMYKESKSLLKIWVDKQSWLFWLGLAHIFFRNETFFVCQDRQLKFLAYVWFRISWYLTKFQLSQTTHRKNWIKSCLYELNKLKFCKVSRNLKNRCWKCSFLDQQMAPWWRNFGVMIL